MSNFAVTVNDLQSTPVAYELAAVEGVRWTTVHPGGCGVARFQMAAEGLAIPPYFGFNYKVDIWRDGVCLWSGLMDPPSLAYSSASGFHWEVTASGWGVLLSAQVDATQNVRNQLTSTVVTNAITNLVPEFALTGFATSITATGFTLSNTADINLTFMTAIQQIMWAAKFGDSSDASQVIYVYPDDVGTVGFSFLPRPSSPAYTMRLADTQQARFSGNRHGYANRVTIQYNAGASSYSANDTTKQGAGPAGVNHIHEALVVLGELTNVADATQAADAILAARSVLKLAPNGPIVVHFNTPVMDANGALVPPWRLRAGFVMSLTDVWLGEAMGTNLAFYPQFLIAETDVDEEAQTVTIIPESFDTYIESQVARVQALLGGRHTV